MSTFIRFIWIVLNITISFLLNIIYLFIFCLCVLIVKTQKDEKSNPAPSQTAGPKKKETKPPASQPCQPALISSPIMLPLNFPANATAPNVTTVTPQPVIVNNQVLFVLFLPIVICHVCVKVCYVIYFLGFLFPLQGFIVTSPQLTNHGLIASLGSHYPTGTSFAIVPGQ